MLCAAQLVEPRDHGRVFTNLHKLPSLTAQGITNPIGEFDYTPDGRVFRGIRFYQPPHVIDPRGRRRQAEPPYHEGVLIQQLCGVSPPDPANPEDAQHWEWITFVQTHAIRHRDDVRPGSKVDFRFILRPKRNPVDPMDLVLPLPPEPVALSDHRLDDLTRPWMVTVRDRWPDRTDPEFRRRAEALGRARPASERGWALLARLTLVAGVLLVPALWWWARRSRGRNSQASST